MYNYFKKIYIVIPLILLGWQVRGQNVILTDTDSGGAINDGMIDPGEYPVYTSGVGSGFGDLIGDNSEIHINSDLAGNLFFALRSGGASFYDFIVIYIDSQPNGFSSTVSLTDAIDLHRAAISGYANSGQSSDLYFATGFEADFAIAIDQSFVGLWKLSTGSLIYQKSLDLKDVFNNPGPEWEISGLEMTDIGSMAGGCFRYVITYLNANNAYRSNEFHGVAVAPPSNIGNNPYVLSSDDFNVFQSYNPHLDGRKLWVGVNSEWQSIFNWCHCSVPGTSHDVLITLAGNNPVINSGNVVNIKSLELEEGASIEIKTNAQLNISGN